MAIITTGSHPKALWPGVKAYFGKSYNEKPVVAEKVFDLQTSDKAYEEYVEEAGFGLAPRKPEGMGVSYDTDKQGYISRLTNVTYALRRPLRTTNTSRLPRRRLPSWRAPCVKPRRPCLQTC